MQLIVRILKGVCKTIIHATARLCPEHTQDQGRLKIGGLTRAATTSSICHGIVLHIAQSLHTITTTLIGEDHYSLALSTSPEWCWVFTWTATVLRREGSLFFGRHLIPFGTENWF